MHFIQTLQVIVNTIIEKIQGFDLCLEKSGAAVHTHFHITAVYRPYDLLYTEQYFMKIVPERHMKTLFRKPLDRYRTVLIHIDKIDIRMKQLSGIHIQNDP